MALVRPRSIRCWNCDTQIALVVYGRRRRAGGIRPFQSFPMGNTHHRTNREQSSIIFEHCPMLFEVRSISSGRITIAKPSGLGMVSSFKASEVRLLF
jgi:hypothetical protein